MLLLGPETYFDGLLETPESVVIEGEFRGELRAANIQISEGAYVSAVLVAAEVVISGTAADTIIYADRITLQGGSRVTGELYHAQLNLAADCYFEGRSRRHPAPRSLAQPAADT